MAGAKAGAKKRASAAGRELGRLGAKKGGRARARSLSPAERSDIARRAVQARWAKAGKSVGASNRTSRPSGETPHSLFRGPVTLGGSRFQGHVLDDGQRVLEEAGVLQLFTGDIESTNLSRHLRHIPGFDERLVPVDTVVFSAPGGSSESVGYRAESVVDLCQQVLVAREAGALKKQQLNLATQAESVVRACARLGIIGAVDEATGFRRVQAHQALRHKVQALIADEVGQWSQQFPTKFWKELARLEGSKYIPHQRPIEWGRLVVAFVYDAVDPDLGRELRRDRSEPLFRPSLHRWLVELGHSRLEGQIDQIIAKMRLCRDMDDFESRFAKVLQKTPLLAQHLDELG